MIEWDNHRDRMGQFMGKIMEDGDGTIASSKDGRIKPRDHTRGFHGKIGIEWDL